MKPDLTLIPMFKSLGDETRLQIVTFLGQEGPLRVSDLAVRFDMSLNAVSRHIKLLEAAGLVSRQISGREHLIALDPRALNIIAEWLQQSQNLWQQRLERLETLITNPDGKD